MWKEAFEKTHTYTYTLWQLVYGVPLFQVHNEIHIAPYANNINDIFEGLP